MSYTHIREIFAWKPQKQIIYNQSYQCCRFFLDSILSSKSMNYPLGNELKCKKKTLWQWNKRKWKKIPQSPPMIWIQTLCNLAYKQTYKPMARSENITSLFEVTNFITWHLTWVTPVVIWGIWPFKVDHSHWRPPEGRGWAPGRQRRWDGGWWRWPGRGCPAVVAWWRRWPVSPRPPSTAGPTGGSPAFLQQHTHTEGEPLH